MSVCLNKIKVFLANNTNFLLFINNYLLCLQDNTNLKKVIQ
jgi:hypothetical protein